MKKRKSPVALITVLVVLAAGAVFWNARSRAVQDQPPNQPTPANSQEPAQAPTTAAMAKDLSSKVGTVVPGAKIEKQGPPMLMKGAGPMRAASGKKAPPVDPSSQTAGQWYQSDSALSK